MIGIMEFNKIGKFIKSVGELGALLRGKYAYLKDLEEKRIELEAELKDIQSALEKAKEEYEYDDAKSVIRVVASENKELERLLNEKNARLKDAERKRIELEAKLKDAQSALEKAKEEEVKVCKIVNERDSSIREQKQEKITLEETLKTLNREKNEVIRQLRDVRNEKGEKEKKLAEVLKELEAIKKELEASKKELEASKKELEASKKELAEALEKLEASKKELEEKNVSKTEKIKKFLRELREGTNNTISYMGNKIKEIWNKLFGKKKEKANTLSKKELNIARTKKNIKGIKGSNKEKKLENSLENSLEQESVKKMDNGMNKIMI